MTKQKTNKTPEAPLSPEEFEKKRYLVVRNMISAELAETCTLYAKAREAHNFGKGDSLAPRSHTIYADFLMESMLELLQPRMEALTGLELYPSYSYYRVYKSGEMLKEHLDRSACEISLTLCLGYDYLGKDYKWRINMDDNKVALEPGDGVVYRGCELKHSRTALQIKEKGWHTQVFLHWVEKGGPNDKYKYDQRPGLYLSKHTRIPLSK